MLYKLIPLLSMFLGVLLVLLGNAFLVSGRDFSLSRLWNENRIRLFQGTTLISLIYIILVIDGEGFLDVLQHMGWLIVTSSNAGIGALVMAFIIKFQKTDIKSVQ